MEKKENRKIRYTKMVIRSSLMELMKSKSILDVSIKDICELADISRTTFYAYYKDQYDLLRQIEEETFIYIENIHGKFKEKNNKKDIIQMLEETLTYIANNGDSTQVLLSENGDASFQKKLFQHLINHNPLANRLYENQYDNETRKYYSVYNVHGSIGLIQHWLKNNMSIPIPQFARMMCNLFG